jgi:diguanylate cyclase (GGDEF)-like protein
MKNGKKIVALCTSRIYDPQIQGYVEILNESLKKQDARLWIYAINADIYWKEDNLPAETHVFDFIRYDYVDVVIIMDEKIKSRGISRKIIKDASGHNVPVIVVDGKYEGTVSINYDYAAGFEQIVRHVVEHHGVKKPHYMAGFKDNKFSEERKEVFKKVIEENGIPFDESMVSYGDFWAIPARAAAQKLIDEKRIPEAIICANDIMAINVCDVFKENGYKIPEDVIVTGFDGYDEALLANPGVTTVSCKTQGLADTVTNVIFECFEGKNKDEYSVLPVLMENESCGCDHNASAEVMLMRRFNNNFYRFQDDIREYQGISVAMQVSQTREQMMICLHSYFTRNMCCIVNADCFESDRNFFLEKEHSDKYRILYDPYHYSAYPDPFDLADVVPEYEKRVETGYPLIFNALDFMGKTFGYVCYLFENYDIIDYSKTTSLTHTVDSGLGGYVNMQYQHYLMGRLEETYKTDALTGLSNRLASHVAFEELKNDPEAQGKPLTVIMSDLDGLKKINDSLGHSAGDKAIASVAEALKNSCPEGSICVRFGGDEMLAFIVGDCDCEEIIRNIKSKLIEKSEECGIRISASCGYYITTLDQHTDIDSVIRKADERMYENKHKDSE